MFPLLAADSGTEGYIANPDTMFEGLWTNFVNTDEGEEALVRLKSMRAVLQKPGNNLFHSYLPGSLTGNLNSTADVACAPATATTRTLDGSCNYPDDPLAGAAGTRLGRNVPPGATHPDMANLLHPNPLLVSARLLHRTSRTDYAAVPFLNMWAAAWIQFQTHDWFVHGPPDNSAPISVPMPPEHPLSGVAPTMVVGATRRDTTRTAAEEAVNMPPTTINSASHWWDGSQLYGSDAVTSARLREGAGGRMKLTAQRLLPLNPRGFGDAGVSENWWLGLELLHTLFVREHNAIAARLAAAYPSLTDQQLFDKARMTNAALMAKIHTLEWTPAILPNNNLHLAMRTNWAGSISMMSPLEQVAIAPFQPPPNEGLYGYRGGPRMDAGVRFSMTEEFVSVYRMHALLPDSFLLQLVDGSSLGRVWTSDTTLAAARTTLEKHGFANIAATFGANLPGSLTLHNYPLFMANITLPNNLGPLDLAAVDIIRDRERGVPRYNQFRRLLQLKPLPSIEALTPDPAARAALASVYGIDIEAVDLAPGMLAEAHRPDCFGFGETQFQVFLLMASRRLAADRFFTSDYTAASYTQAGLDWVESSSFGDVLRRHLPELAAAGIELPPNAFTPWSLPGAQR